MICLIKDTHITRDEISVSGMMESYGQDGDDPLFHLPDF